MDERHVDVSMEIMDGRYARIFLGSAYLGPGEEEGGDRPPLVPDALPPCHKKMHWPYGSVCDLQTNPIEPNHLPCSKTLRLQTIPI